MVGLSISMGISCRQKDTPDVGMHETGLRYSLKSQADRYLEQFNGVVLLKKDEEVLLKKAYNMTSDTSSTLYVTEESQFDLRSVAKLFARVAVQQLEEDQYLAADDSIGTYLPGFPNGNKITLQHFLAAKEPL